MEPYDGVCTVAKFQLVQRFHTVTAAVTVTPRSSSGISIMIP